MRVVRLSHTAIFRLPRPPVFHEQLRALAIRHGSNWMEFDEEGEAYLAFKKQWDGYVPDDEDIARASAWQEGRSLLVRTVERGADLTVGGIKIAHSLISRVPPAIEAERTGICMKCDYHVPGGQWALDGCRVCGCVLNAKRRLPGQRCPDFPPKWLEWEPVYPALDASAAEAPSQDWGITEQPSSESGAP